MIKVDALLFLLIIETTLILSGVVGFLVLRAKKFDRLYRNLEANSALENTTTPSIAAGKTPADEFDEFQTKISNMQHIIDFQKSMIQDLLSTKDTFENAQQRLTDIQNSHQELQKQLSLRGGLEEKGVVGEGQSGILESSNKELEANISRLKAENESLSSKFRDWQEKLQKLWESPVSAGQEALSPIETRVVVESEELQTKLIVLEKVITEKDRQLKDLETKLENLEKEYLILYQQKQDQEKDQVQID